MLYVLILRKNGIPPAEIERSVEKLARECRPPLRRSECRDALSGGMKPRRIRDRLIADWLLVTPNEAAQLEGWPAASHHPSTASPPPPTKADRTAARRRLMLAIVAMSGGRVPSTRAMGAALDEAGCKVCAKTVANDYLALALRLGQIVAEPTWGRAAQVGV